MRLWVSVWMCWLGAALLAAGRSPPRLRLPYRGEPGRGTCCGVRGVMGGLCPNRVSSAPPPGDREEPRLWALRPKCGFIEEFMRGGTLCFRWVAARRCPVSHAGRWEPPRRRNGGRRVMRKGNAPPRCFPRGIVSHVEWGETEAGRCSSTGVFWHVDWVAAAVRGCSPGVAIPVGSQHPARGWVGARRSLSCPGGSPGAAQPGHPRALSCWEAGAGVPGGPFGCCAGSARF